jgi:hypothetical protein
VTAPALREAAVPSRLPDAAARGPLVEAAPAAVLLRIPNIGRFLVRRDESALVERADGATDADVGCFEDGPVAAAAALLRGEIALRGAAVAIGGKAVALCGVSGAGKSAVAAALALGGHVVLADAVTVISRDADEERFLVQPVAPELRLWPDVAGELGLSEAAGRPVRPALDVRAYRLGPEPVAAPLALVALLSVRTASNEPSIDPVRGAARVQALLGAGWHLGLVDHFGLSADRFGRLADVAASIDCVRVVRPARGAPTAAIAELVEGLVA